MVYLESILKQFEYYQALGDRTFAQLSEDDIHWQINSESNSIAVIVKHMHGNMLARWTDFLTSDGEKEWRNRDDEFEATIKNKTELVAKWSQGWTCVYSALNSVTDDNLEDTIYIRHMGHTVVEAINRQLAHYAYHVGQIVYIGRMIKADDWKSLSIPKGESKAYNQEKFNKPHHREHFTDEFLNKDNI